MKVKFFIPVLLFLLFVPVLANAATQAEIDNLTFLLRQFEWDQWGDGVIDDGLLLDGLPQIRENAINSSDDILRNKVTWAMGETGLQPFVPIIIEELDFDPVIACFALGKISSSDAVDALILELPNDDMQVRAAAAWGLGNMLYTSGMEEAKESAVTALETQLANESEEWVKNDIDAAITLIETGIIDSPIFMDLDE